jgi:hypothetical protein
VKQLNAKVVNKVETILKNHWQSGHYSSSMERLEEIQKSFICFGTVGCGEDATKLWKKRNIQDSY